MWIKFHFFKLKKQKIITWTPVSTCLVTTRDDMTVHTSHHLLNGCGLMDSKMKHFFQVPRWKKWMLDSNMKMTYILSMKHLIKLINYIILEVIRVQSWSLHMCTIMHHGWVEWPYFVLIHLCQPYSWPYIIPKPLSLSVSSIFHVSLSRNSTQSLLQLSMSMSLLACSQINKIWKRNKVIMESL